MKEKVVLDTNVLIAAGFNRSCSSARIVQAIEDGQLEMVWNEATRRESQNVISEIPPQAWGRIESLFNKRTKFNGETPGNFSLVKDPDDRKYAALASAAGAILITNDEHLMKVRAGLGLAVMSPKEFLEHWQALNAH